MVIYLRHFIHGEKVAISELEAEMDRENGWEDFDPSPVSDDTKPPRGGNTKK